MGPRNRQLKARASRPSENPSNLDKPRERMIAAAVCLFARSGFYGTTARDVAKLANVSEGNIFRYFPTMRDLFLGALESELQKLSVRAEALERVAKAENAHAALRSVFKLITETMAKQPELVRLLHFSALEFGPDIEPLFRRYVRPIVEALAAHLQKWSRGNGSCAISPTIAVLSFIATAILLQDFFPAFSGSPLPFESVKSTAVAYAELWCRVLSSEPTANPAKGGAAATSKRAGSRNPRGRITM
jgi:AcrR family transcriptional regulator